MTDYSAPSSLPVVNADGGGKVGGAGSEQDGVLYPPQPSGANEQGLQNEVHEVGGVNADSWDRPFEGQCLAHISWLFIFSLMVSTSFGFQVIT